jgi:hypothetical protein
MSARQAADQIGYTNVAYVEVNTNSFANVGCYTLEDGSQFFDIACIFAANINADAEGQPVLYFNPQVSHVLNETDDVKVLQELGITVLLTVLGNHEDAGWACFTDETVAQTWANQLADCVEQYGLDGIDIDDEYSTCSTNDTSLIMVSSKMREAMPDKIVSKALFADQPYFQSSWDGMTLAEELTNGWEMSYGDPNYGGRLAPYLAAGMQPAQLGLGVSTAGSDGAAAAAYVAAHGIGGVMVYNVTDDSQGYLSTISDVLYGQDIVATPGCLQSSTG